MIESCVVNWENGKTSSVKHFSDHNVMRWVRRGTEDIAATPGGTIIRSDQEVGEKSARLMSGVL